MPATYEKIQSTTLGSAASNITFSSISSAYTDLRLVMTYTNATASVGGAILIQFNGDTATNYSKTTLYGDGGSAASGRNTSVSYISTNLTGADTTPPQLLEADIFSYAGSTYKTVLARSSADMNGTGSTTSLVGLWRSTSAITSIKLYFASYNLGTGTTATLYGILKA